MAWIEVHQALRDHRKVMLLADAVDLSEPHAVGHVIFLWLWALDNAPDGVLPASDRLIERAAAWEGERGALVNALVTVGFIDLDADGTRHLHEWDDYAGRLIEKRRENAERMRAARAAKHEAHPDERAVHVQHTCTARAGATVPYTTVPNSTEPSAAAALPAREDAPTPTREGERETPSIANQTFADLRAYAHETFPGLASTPDRALDRLFERLRQRGLMPDEVRDDLDALAAAATNDNHTGKPVDYGRLKRWLERARPAPTVTPKPGPGGGGTTARYAGQRPEPAAPRLTRFDAVPPLASESPRGAQTSPDPTPPSAAAPPRPASERPRLVEHRAPYAAPHRAGPSAPAPLAVPLVAASG